MEGRLCKVGRSKAVMGGAIGGGGGGEGVVLGISSNYNWTVCVCVCMQCVCERGGDFMQWKAEYK